MKTKNLLTQKSNRKGILVLCAVLAAAGTNIASFNVSNNVSNLSVGNTLVANAQDDTTDVAADTDAAPDADVTADADVVDDITDVADDADATDDDDITAIALDEVCANAPGEERTFNFTPEISLVLFCYEENYSHSIYDINGTKIESNSEDVAMGWNIITYTLTPDEVYTVVVENTGDGTTSFVITDGNMQFMQDLVNDDDTDTVASDDDADADDIPVFTLGEKSALAPGEEKTFKFTHEESPFNFSYEVVGSYSHTIFDSNGDKMIEFDGGTEGDWSHHYYYLTQGDTYTIVIQNTGDGITAFALSDAATEFSTATTEDTSTTTTPAETTTPAATTAGNPPATANPGTGVAKSFALPMLGLSAIAASFIVRKKIKK